MASLVAPLVSGISTAASGSATFVRQGTSTVASVYSDAEGATAVTTHTLDARGAIVRYVEERVTVTVYDSNGAEVTSFVWGTDARDARVENLGWTGPDATGATVAGGRITVDTVLTRLHASLGTTDGNVDVNGVAQTLSASISSSAGLVYNVKSPAYGAEGDGTTDDSGAIQAAINAAATAGGGIIYFPHGTYLCNTGLVVASGEGKFTYLGESATASKIKQGTSGITLLDLGATNNNLLMSLTLTATAANTGKLVSLGANGRATFLECSLDPLNGTQIFLTQGTTTHTKATLIGCSISQAGASSRISDGGATATLTIIGGEISTSGSGLTSFDAGPFVQISNCLVYIGGITGSGAAGTTSFFGSTAAIFGGFCAVTFTSGTVNLATDANLAAVGVSFSTAGAAFNLVTGSSALAEAACQLGTGVSAGTTDVTFSNNYSSQRDHRLTSTSGSATSYTPSGAFGVHEVTSTGASMAFGNPSPGVPRGSFLTILYKNTSGGNITPTFGTDYSFVTAVGQVNNGNTGVFFFIPRPGSVTTDLVCISPQPAGGTTL